MRLATVGAPELLALVDEDVVPLAADFAHAFRHMSEDRIYEQVHAFVADMECMTHRQEGLRALAAAALTALAAIPGTTVLYQTPASTRGIRLSPADFTAFRLGKLRHALVAEDVYGKPAEGDVVRMLEKSGTCLTGRDALAEVLYVSPGPPGAGVSYLLSLRPWRGAGTDSAAQALLDDRRRHVETTLDGLVDLHDLLTDDPHSYSLGQEEQLARGARLVTHMHVLLTRALALCGSRPGQVGQTSTRSSSSPSGQDGKVMVPPGKVITTQIR